MKKHIYVTGEYLELPKKPKFFWERLILFPYRFYLNLMGHRFLYREEMEEFYRIIGGILNVSGYSTTLSCNYYKTTEPAGFYPGESRQYISEQIARADIVFIFLGPPSFTVGQELEIAKDKEKEVILMHFENRDIPPSLPVELQIIQQIICKTKDQGYRLFEEYIRELTTKNKSA